MKTVNRKRAAARASAARSHSAHARRGMLLVAVLVIITVLALLGASFAFKMNSDLSSVTAINYQQQARLSVDSGIARAIFVLRDKRNDIDEWFNKPERFRRILVWSPDKIGGSESLADQEPIPGQPAWRFSIVSYDIEGEGENTNVKIRYGLTDEASKLNLNVASREQLIKLFDQIKHDYIRSADLADALIDWRDSNDEMNSSRGAESSYYIKLDPPYRAKNRPLETIDELLMVRAFNGRILYGEDYNQNGYLDVNEDDGPDGSFPPDDADGVLDRGLLPLVTVYSWDFNSANDNRQRININAVKFATASSALGNSSAAGGASAGAGAGKSADGSSGSSGGSSGGKAKTQTLPDDIAEELGPDVVQFIAEAQKRGHKFRSVGELLGLEVFEDGSSNYDDMWKEYDKERRKANKIVDDGESEEDTETQPADGSDERDTGSNTDTTELSDPTDPNGSSAQNEPADDNNANQGNSSGSDSASQDTKDKKDGRRNQSVRDGTDNPSLNKPGDAANAQPPPGVPPAGDYRDNNRAGRGGRNNGGNRDTGRRSNDQTGKDGKNTNPGGGATKSRKGTPVVSPVQPSQMNVIMDRLTVDKNPAMFGLINVNTASPMVLRTIPGLTEEQVQAIVAKRKQLSGTDKQTIGWLVANTALDPETFAVVCGRLTTRSLQFSADVIGFADHVGAAKRVQAIIEMRGQMAQIKYYRDITSLGLGYPVHDDQRQEGFSFAAR